MSASLKFLAQRVFCVRPLLGMSVDQAIGANGQPSTRSQKELTWDVALPDRTGRLHLCIVRAGLDEGRVRAATIGSRTLRLSWLRTPTGLCLAV